MNEKTETFGVWNHCSNSALRRASRQLGQLYDDLLSPSGLRITQFTLMTEILFSREPSLKALARALVMDLSALGHTLKPLIRDGIVELVPDARDRRVKRARLTEKGRKLWEETNLLWQEAQRRFDTAFGKDESEALRRAMDVISSRDFALAFANAKTSDGAASE
ncbi:MarR family winged helix-turn-helix transcriptional regulator [Rhizobium binxianense]